MTPEIVCKRALHQLLINTYAPAAVTRQRVVVDDAAGITVAYGPPPTDVATPVVVWCGRVDTASEADVHGRQGVEDDLEVTVDVNVDVVSGSVDQVDVDVEVRAQELVGQLRDAIRQARAVRRSADDDPRLIAIPDGWREVLWSSLLSTTSEGPLPLEGGGWSCTVVAPVRFFAKSA